MIVMVRYSANMYCSTGSVWYVVRGTTVHCPNESLIITCGTYVHPGSTYYYYRFFSIITFYYTYTYLSRVRRVRRHLVTPLKSEIKPTQVIDLNAEW